MSLTVIEPGPLSLVVDLGRPRHRSLGVPLGGAADRAAFLQANALVGNSDEAALEFALVGPTLRADADITAVIFGAPFDQAPRTTFQWKAGTTLRIGPCKVGARGYLAVAGGFQVPITLGSRSAFEPLHRGDVLDCSGTATSGRSLADPVVSYTTGTAIIRCLPGPQADWFDLSMFAGAGFTVTPASNRMGLRLQGEPLVRTPGELTSEPVCPGTVQVINDGQCIVLGVDGQTIGGYPKIAQVIAADLDLLGQLRPGQPVLFEFTTLAAAEAAFAERCRQLQRRLFLISRSEGMR